MSTFLSSFCCHPFLGHPVLDLLWDSGLGFPKGGFALAEKPPRMSPKPKTITCGAHPAGLAVQGRFASSILLLNQVWIKSILFLIDKLGVNKISFQFIQFIQTMSLYGCVQQVITINTLGSAWMSPPWKLNTVLWHCLETKILNFQQGVMSVHQANVVAQQIIAIHQAAVMVQQITAACS